MQSTWKNPAWNNSRLPSSADERLRHVERIARLMDSEYQIPGTKFRFGLDPLLGLIPGVGNFASSIVSCLLVWTMMNHGASRNVVARMAVNVLIDSVIGAIPIVGNLFDFAFRANDRNVELLRRHYREGAYQGSGAGFLLAVAAVICVVIGASAWLVFQLLARLIGLLS